MKQVYQWNRINKIQIHMSEDRDRTDSFFPAQVILKLGDGLIAGKLGYTYFH